MVDMTKRVIDLTAGELLELIQGAISAPAVTVAPDTGKAYVYGLAGLQELFNCSKNTASRIKQSGVIDAAITQVGSLIITDAKKALELRNLAQQRKKRR